MRAFQSGPTARHTKRSKTSHLMRVQPRMIVISPCDSEEARKATIAAASWNGPVYLRFGREKTPIMTTPETPFAIGKAEVFLQAENPQAVIFATAAYSAGRQQTVLRPRLRQRLHLSDNFRLAGIREMHRKHLEVARRSGFVYVRHHTHCECPEFFEASTSWGFSFSPSCRTMAKTQPRSFPSTRNAICWN